MPIEITVRLSPREAADPQAVRRVVALRAGVSDGEIAALQVIRRSVDARRGPVVIDIALRLYLKDEIIAPAPAPHYRDVRSAPAVVIVGCGPAGLFCALRLLEHGLRPILLERGRAVSDRKKDIANINRGGVVDPDSNYSFGEGGAGTFSDGKLYTRSKKRGDYSRALQVLAAHGADPSIIYESHPHVGTDKLPTVITNIRSTITGAGGEILFGKKVTDLIVRSGKIKGVVCGDEKFESEAVVLATGHSARDIYRTLDSLGIALEAKDFAMGVRVEHPQELIDRIQYRGSDRKYLPAASYSLVTQAGGRGVYSFCMCPGGFIVPAMTAPGECVVNGMSPSQRNSPFANSGLVTQVRRGDYAFLEPEYGVLAGMEFQQRLERAAFAAGGEGQKAPAQRVTDFLSGKVSASLPKTSYVPGVVSTDLAEVLPEFISSALASGLRDFDKKIRGFVTDQALLVGVESRTSSPVRIPRDPQTLQHPGVEGLFPAAEGAGYAGGIISAALDGENIAEAIAVHFGK